MKAMLRSLHRAIGRGFSKLRGKLRFPAMGKRKPLVVISVVLAIAIIVINSLLPASAPPAPEKAQEAAQAASALGVFTKLGLTFAALLPAMLFAGIIYGLANAGRMKAKYGAGTTAAIVVGISLFLILNLMIWTSSLDALRSIPGRWPARIAVLDWALPITIVGVILWWIGARMEAGGWIAAMGGLCLVIAVGGGIYAFYLGEPLYRGYGGPSPTQVAATVGVPIAGASDGKVWNGGVPPRSTSTDPMSVMGKLRPIVLSATGPFEVRCIYSNGQVMTVAGDTCPSERLTFKYVINPGEKTLFFTYAWRL